MEKIKRTTRIEFKKLIANISTQFINLPVDEIAQAIEETLAALAKFAGAERCSIMLFSDDHTTLQLAYEWHISSLEPRRPTYKQLTRKQTQWLIKKAERSGIINIKDIDTLADNEDVDAEGVAATVKLLKLLDVRSILIIPMISGQEIMGLTLFETNTHQNKWSQNIISLLKIANETLFNAFERQRVEEALRRSEERFRRVITSISDHIYFYEISDDGQHVDLYLSPNIADLTGYPFEKFQDNWAFWPTEVIHPKDRAKAATQASRLTHGENSQMEYRLLRADGSIIWVRDSARAEKSEGSTLVYGVVADVTERKQVETALAEERALLAQRVKERTAELSLANAQLSQANRMKDEFLAAMSHELRTPLNAVLGMSEALHEEVYGEVNERQKNALRRIESSGKHLLTLINDILDISRIEAGKLVLQMGSIEAEDFCLISLRLLKAEAQKKNLEVNTNLQSGLVFQADERRLRQILINLLSNAIKFTPQGGKIGLEVYQDPEQPFIHFKVWDTGIGIAKEDIEHLFEPFVQLDSRLSRSYEGTGLGLALVYRLAKMHQGSITIESEVGKGSSFTVSLPLQALGGAEISELTAEPGITSTLSVDSDNPLILLAEDNEANLITFSNFLIEAGFQVSVARNGPQVLEQVREEPPDLILMDIQMPVIDGLEAASQIRADERLQDIPIIGLTALILPTNQNVCSTHGIDKCLPKPVSRQQLIETVRAHLPS